MSCQPINLKPNQSQPKGGGPWLFIQVIYLHTGFDPQNSCYTLQRPTWVALNGKGTYGLKPKTRYYYQVQAHMFVTGARRVFTTKVTFVMLVDRDDHFIQQCLHALTSYYVQTYLHFLLHEEHIEIPQNIIEA